MRQITMSFCGQWLRIAREFRLLTQSELAQKTSASAALISLCEADKNKRPSRDLVEAWGAVLGFKPECFYAPLEDVFQEEECNFRYRGTTPKRIKAQVRAHATLIGVVIRALRSRHLFTPVNVPRAPLISTRQDVEMAAEQCRHYWKLGLDGAIQHLRQVLEAAGVIVVNHLVRTKEVDTFSRYSDRMALIFPNQEIQSSSVWNFEIAHELGHMVMHRGIQTGNRETEEQADLFARAFLMPSRAFGSEFQAIPFSWNHVFRLKKHWNVSAAAILNRAYELKLLGALDYRKARKDMYSKAWVKQEPREARPELSGLFEKALNGLGQKKTLTIDLAIEKLCEQLYFIPETFYHVTGIAIAPKNMPPSGGMETLSAVSVILPSPSEAVVASAPAAETGAQPETQPSEPYGMDSVRSGTKEIFLLRGADNCELARHRAQEGRAVGIEIWHPEYRDLEVFNAVERFWVVINRSDDRAANIRFLQSIADDSSIREKSRVTTVESTIWMSDLFKWVLKRQSSQDFSGNLLEEVYRFKPVPRPGDGKQIEALTEPPPPPKPMAVSQNW